MCQCVSDHVYGLFLMTGYRGYSCLDDSEAQSDLSQLIEFLLLTLSNIAFLVAACVASYKRCYSAAVVYFFTMFFSTVSSRVVRQPVDLLATWKVYFIGERQTESCSYIHGHTCGQIML